MKESQMTEEKCMEQFVSLLKRDIENFEAEPEQMKHFMSELLPRIEELGAKKTGEEGMQEKLYK
ncbi:MAG: hypothetical protein NC489_46200 [Ruminococcus flavefaciens]|nr:hypothetical protein [Ruminococcus flavefaciens]